MSHEIETMAYAGAVPWHGLGNPVSNEMTTDEMMKAAGVDWSVQMTSNHYPPDHAQHPSEPVPESHFIERTDDGKILGNYVTGGENGYKVFQNKELFDFFKPFIEDKSMFLHTAGSLFGGQKVWCMATTNEGFTLGGDDQINNNLLFTISHTGMAANSALLTPIRVVCNNTMRLAFKDADDIIRHNHKVPFDAEAMKTALGISSQNFGEFEHLAKAMAKKVLTGEEELEFFKYVFAGKEREKDGKVIQPEGVRKAMAYFRGQSFVAENAGGTPASRVTKKQLEEQNIAQARTLQELIDNIKAGKKIDELVLEGATITPPQDAVEATTTGDEIVNSGWELESANGTLWGAYQTVMWMADHKPVRNYGDDIRLDNALYGGARGTSDVKTKAHTMALEMAA